MKKFFLEHRDMATLIVAVLLSLATMWVGGGTALSTPRQLGLTVVGFFQGSVTTIWSSITRGLDSIRQLGELQAQYIAVQNRLIELETNQGDLILLRQENERLREALGFASAVGVPNIPAQVVGKASGVYFNTLTLNKGYSHGVAVGMPVIAIQDGRQGLVGKVLSVSAFSSLVEPIFSSTLYVGARLASSRFDGLLQGGGDLLAPLVLRYVDSKAQGLAFVGEEVITSGLTNKYPPGIPIGRITAVRGTTYESTMSFEIQPNILLTRLEFVYILANVPEEALL